MIGELKAEADVARAAILRRFFKTGPGEYGEGDRFLGIPVPKTRRMARQYSNLPSEQIEKLLQSDWHEVRFAALVILIMQYEGGGGDTREAIFRLYLRSTDRINNWDLVDCSAPSIVGAHLAEATLARRDLGGQLQTEDWTDILGGLARSSSLWERRIAIVSTLGFVRRNQVDPTFAIATRLLHDRHDLIQKACGWALREAGKRSEKRLRSFLRTHYTAIGRTTLRYAIERFPPEQRKQILGNVWLPDGTSERVSQRPGKRRN